jgi:hypothetical protein
MKKITVLEPVDFLNYCLSFAEEVVEERNNYQQPHHQLE